MSNAASPQPQREKVNLDPLYCRTPRGIGCDGIDHHWAVFDEDINRWVPLDGSCPHRHRNRAVDSYWRFREDGLGHADALAAVRAHGGDL